MDEVADKKSRGAFFTPAPLARFVARWAIRSASDTVLEPSCGEAAFLLAAAGQLSLLGSKFAYPNQLRGVELHEPSATAAQLAIRTAGADADIVVDDFFMAQPGQLYDAVIGNPPFIRYQEFSGAVRARSLEAALAQGVRLSGLASSWAAFTVHASCFVKENGRLGLVLPAELLTVGYAAEVRRFLLRRFGKVRLVLFDKRVFPEVLEDTILLLAEGTGQASHFEVYQAKSADDLGELDIKGWTDHRPDSSDRWTPALLDLNAYGAFEEVTDGSNIGHLIDWGSAYLGAVTGDNSFFCLSQSDISKLGLADSDYYSISPPGARHLQGFTLTATAWDSLRKEEKRVYLFSPKGDPSRAASGYIRLGEDRGVNLAYKCKMRNPWWRVPLTSRPDFVITYMNNERVRFVQNEAGVDVLNSLYGFKLTPWIDKDIAKLLPIALLNSVTLLSAELCGRVHGGGMLKHEPRGLDKLSVPSEACLLNAKDSLEAIAPQVGRLLRKSNIAEAVRLVDNAILINTAGVSQIAVDTIDDARRRLLGRRLSLANGAK